jgi:hypothetical protein
MAMRGSGFAAKQEKSMMGKSHTHPKSFNFNQVPAFYFVYAAPSDPASTMGERNYILLVQYPSECETGSDVATVLAILQVRRQWIRVIIFYRQL